MTGRGMLGAFLLLAIGAAWGEGLGGKFRSMEARAQIEAEAPGVPSRGVLVLADTAVTGEWRAFAGDARLALVHVALNVAEKDPCERIAARNPEQLLAKVLRRMGLSDRPLYVYGFRAGGDFALRVANGDVGKVATWAGYGLAEFPVAARETPYGVVAAGDLDEGRYDAARDYVAELRRRGGKAAWVSVPGRVGENAKVEAFVRRCFAQVADPNRREILVDNEAKTELGGLDGRDAGSTSILPSAAVRPAWAELHRPNRVIVRKVDTGLKEFPEITFAVRLPRGGGTNPRILAYSYWYTEPGTVLKTARNDGFVWNRFADERGLAVVTWNVRTLWQNLRSFDEISDRDIAKQNQLFDAVARAWESGIVQLARDQHLRDFGILLYGCSRGANFAIRLAARDPKRLAAVVAHVANSFERPSPVVANVIWAITNGELDPGVKNARRFYERCREMGLPVFLRFFPALGHAENAESLRFARGFFDYALSQDGAGNRFAEELARRVKSPGYVADLTNYLVFPAARRNEVPEDQRISIPDERLARLWGRLPAAAGKWPEPADEAGTEAPEKKAAAETGPASTAGAGTAPGAERKESPRVGEVNGAFGRAVIRYDGDNRVAQIDYATGTRIRYGYDTGGRLAFFTIEEPGDKLPGGRKIGFPPKERASPAR